MSEPLAANEFLKVWPSSPPISLSILSAQVQVEVLSFIITLEYTKLLWFLLSLFPSVLFVFFCRKSSVSYLSLISLFLPGMEIPLQHFHVFLTTHILCTRKRVDADGRCCVCMCVEFQSSWLQVSIDTRCAVVTLSQLVTHAVSELFFLKTYSESILLLECPMSSLNFPWVEGCCVSLPELVLSQSQ